jgi:hypothetical protein
MSNLKTYQLIFFYQHVVPNVAVDDEPEKERDCIPYLIVLAALIWRLILDCCGVHAPLVTSWQGCWITIVLIILGSKVVLIFRKKIRQ